MISKSIAYATLIAGILSFSGCRQDNHRADTSAEVVRIAAGDDPHTLDPRLARNLETATVLHMLYEGLMRSDFHGKPIPAIAEEVKISNDQKTYTFKLRKSVWSNGEPLIANDFVDTWKTILDPKFPAPNAYQFYQIKGAKAAKEGKASFEDAGIKAIDPYTIVIELESPAPYFLEMLTTHFFYPVHKNFSAENVITNGPFKLDQWQKHHEFAVVKSPHYWDANEVKLSKIILMPLDEHTALRMYESGELEWAGSPMGVIPQDAMQSLKMQHQLHISPAAGTHWFRVNTARAPFQTAKMRRAFAYALDRKAIVEHITQGNQKPATAVVPPSMGLHPAAFFEDHDIPKAWYSFQEALEESHISKDDFPVVSLCYANGDRNHKIAQAVQQQWKKALGIEVKLDNCESQVFYDRLGRQDFQLAIGSWFADFQDPINFLEVFKYKTNRTNNTQWENQQYITLLNNSAVEDDPVKRLAILKKAEEVLMTDMPVIPVFFASYNYVKAENLLGVYFSDLGYLDFKFAFYGE